MKKIFSIMAVAVLTFSISTVYTLAEGDNSTVEPAFDVRYETFWDLLDSNFNPKIPQEDRWMLDYWVGDYIKNEPVDSEGIRVTVKVAADEEFRAKHEGYWQEYTFQLIEKMDDSMYRDFNINFTIEEYAEWQTDGNSAVDITHELNSEMRDDENFDFVIGFTIDENYDSAKGMAITWAGVNTVYGVESPSKMWRTILHEVGHNYGIPHCELPNIDCIMGHNLHKVDHFCDDHTEMFEENKYLHGTPQ
ncbi:M12 family metallo-peptidase [Longirhabdus pacifica]|uniref:M12 family metallo-peptidase n=1 Tax=Longirhabdus pacifica TaxID=2305227 RepID=UPI0013E8E34D|nr:M12 family metallo-peptidase [Longirhabdus pacifica]